MDQTARTDETKLGGSAAQVSAGDSRAFLASPANAPALHNPTTVTPPIGGDAGSTDERSLKAPEPDRGILQYASAGPQRVLSSDTKLALSDADLTTANAARSATAAPASTLTGREDRTPDLPVDRQIRLAAGAEYELNQTTTLGASLVYVDLGDAEINRPALRGEYSDNQYVFLGLYSKWKW